MSKKFQQDDITHCLTAIDMFFTADWLITDTLLNDKIVFRRNN